MLKRGTDIVLSAAGLLILSPLFFLVAAWIAWDSPGGILFRQVRVGRNEKIFRIRKFRTMVMDAELKGPQITLGCDSRITRVGKFLRKYKLDELPQLIDVFLGTMSLVGPRPEVPRYVGLYTDAQRSVVFSVRPGITDLASIHFRNENDLLADAKDPVEFYTENILPIKIAFYERYVLERSFWGDIRIIIKTLSLTWCGRDGRLSSSFSRAL